MGTKNQILILPFLLVAFCFLGSNVLDVLHYPQSDPSSGALFRLHPLTYLLFFLWMIRNIRFSTIYEIYDPVPRIYGIIVFAVFVFSITLGKSKANFFVIDTLFASVLVVQLLQDESDHFRQRVIYWLKMFFFFNCFLAIIERGLSKIIFEPTDPAVFESFRSYALTGHPLNSALMTSSLTLFFVVIAPTTQKKFLYFAVGMMALFAFGARASLGTMMISFPFLLYLDLKNYESGIAAGKFFNYLFLFTIAILLCWYILAFTSFGERIFNSSKFDDDSADVRSRVFDMFRHFTLRDLLFGITDQEIMTAMYLEKVDIIENFWIVWIFKYGIILTALLGVSLFIYLIGLLKNAGSLTKYILAIQFFVAASGNNSLATNTTAITILTLAAVCGINAYSFEMEEEPIEEDYVTINV